MPKKTDISRRKFLQYTGVLTGAAAALAPSLAVGVPGAQGAAHSHGNMANPLTHGMMFFTNSLEFSTLSAAAERIFPKDSTGPGATELGVAYFIDNQLAGGWGYNAREYTSGPYSAGVPGQGYQTPVLRRDIFKQGLMALNAESNRRYKKDFADTNGPEQDQVLRLCESGKISTEGFSSSYFFSLLLTAVLAGAYSDPLYNGNSNMEGWKMKQYPGAQMSYEYIMQSDKFEEIDPMSLSSMQ